MGIEHIVISGGGYKGLYTIGALKHLSSIDFYNITNIKSIYGSSVGGIIGLLLCLKLKLGDICEHVINRPWQNLFHFSPEDILNIISKKGLLDKTFIVTLFDNFFKNAGFSKDATMKDIYEFSNITLYLFTVNISTFELEIISHKTHPDMEILDAIYMGCSIPFIFQPHYFNKNFYIDGGVINPYPLNICIDDKIEKDKILAFKIIDDKLESSGENDTIFQYGFYLFYTLIKRNYNFAIEGEIKHELIIPSVTMNITDARNIITDVNTRARMITEGEKYAKLFLKYKSKNN